jgi:hypothetical protein
MNFRLVDCGWDKEFIDALHKDRSTIRVVCPFIKRRAAERLVKRGRVKLLQIITRFNLNDFGEGVSDTSALRLLLEAGAQIRGVRNLHAKLYLFGMSRAIVTSANLTEAALLRNHELGFVTENAGIIGRCGQYFDDLWERAGQDLSEERLTEWERKITSHLATGASQAWAGGLGEEGIEVEGSSGSTVLPAWVGEAEQAFVKFFGKSDNRADRTRTVFELVQSSGCHWACTYPKGKRPRQVQDGAVMFMGRLVDDPHDILIYGRAVGMHHKPGRDDATNSDKRKKPWKEKWPHYVRVHHGEFLAGELSNGVSLNELMNALRSNTFRSTQRNAARGEGNTDPRRAYMQQAAVELTPQGMAWLNARLQRAFAQHGQLSPTMLQQLDWPAIPSHAKKGKR